MKCEIVRDNIVLMHYGELPDELAVELEQHLGGCEDCRRELNARMRAMDEVFRPGAAGAGAFAESAGAIASAAG